MKFFAGVFTTLLLAGLFTVNAHALSGRNPNGMSYGEYPLNGQISDQGPFEASQTASPRENGLQDDDLQLFKRFQDTVKKSDEFPVYEGEFAGQVQGAKPESASGKIILRVQPGDGLVSADWRVLGQKAEAGEPPLKFSLFYGTESGRLTRKIEIGPASGYRLRGLTNNQPYYLRVMGYREGTTVVSPEEKAIPLPLEEQPSLLERSFAEKNVTMQDRIEADPFKRDLKQFGYDFFKNTLLTGQTTENLPVGGDYVLGPGDSLHIAVWGSIQGDYTVEVDRNGEISIPKAGVANVWGLNFAQAKDAINNAISRYYKGYELNVTLDKLRTIQVFVVGEVENPGIYTISSLSTVINALSAAGGPSKNGSLRNIKVRKKNKPPEDVDLYDFFLYGDRSRDIRLGTGDTVFVPVIGPVAAVAGEIKRPAIYELKEKNSLSQVLLMAGGISATGYAGRIQVERVEGNSAKIILDYDPAKSAENPDNVAIFDHDMIKVFPVNSPVRRMVKLVGNVFRPGEYQFKPGMKVTDILTGFEALLPESHLEAAEIKRIRFPDMQKEVVSFNLGKALQGDERENIALQEQDEIHVFHKWEMQEKPKVSITGPVENPGVFDYYPKMTVRDLVVAAGSLKRNAYLDQAELTRVFIENGAARSRRVNINLARAVSGDPDQNYELRPDDALIVRGVENWLDANDRFVTVRGEVRFPGVYSIGKGEKLSSVIARAGGFSEKAYLKGAKFTRRSVRESQQKQMDEMIRKSEQDILKKQGELASLSASKEELEATKAALDGLMRSLQKLKESRAEGRVVIHLTGPDKFADGPYDIELFGGDTLVVPQLSQVVNVLGEVYNPTSFVHMSEEDVSYYLNKAGGPNRNGDEDSIYLVKVDGSVMSREQSSFGISWDDDSHKWTFGGFMSSHPDPGDTLVVPQKLERIAWMREIKDIATILGQIALTAGVLIAAGL